MKTNYFWIKRFYISIFVATLFVCSLFVFDSTALESQFEMSSINGWSNLAGSSAKFSAGVVDDSGDLWLVPYNSEVLVKISSKTETVSEFNLGLSSTSKFKSGVFDDSGNLWLIPSDYSSILKFNKATETFTTFNNWPVGVNGNSISKFFDCVYENKKIWLIPMNASSVVVFDTETETMEALNNWPGNLGATAVLFSAGVKDQSGNLWLVPYNANAVVKIDMNTRVMERFDAFPPEISMTPNEKFSNGVFDGTRLWLIPSSAAAIVSLNTSTGEMQAFTNFPMPVTSTNKFSAAVFDGEKIWIAPSRAEKMLSLDTITAEMEAVVLPNGAFDPQTALKFSDIILDSVSFWLVPYNSPNLLRLIGKSDISLSISTTEKVYLPDKVKITAKIKNEKPNSTIGKIDYFVLKTTDSTTVTKSNFDSLFGSASVCGSLETPTNVISANENVEFVFDTEKNGIFWVRVTVLANDVEYQYIEKVKIDNIYKSSLKISGQDKNGNNLYSDNLTKQHGTPIEFDGTLIAAPSKGFDTVEIFAKSISGYRISGSDKKTITLDSDNYLSAPGNNIVFNYLRQTTISPGTPKPPPTKTPTPTIKPTITPTIKPSATPTVKPTITPTVRPSATPTANPTATPTVKPTGTPTPTPSQSPNPTIKPTSLPTANPTFGPQTPKPTNRPTLRPTSTPSQTPKPTKSPAPTTSPSPNPTEELNKTFTLKNFGNSSQKTVFNYMIVDNPKGLDLTKGKIPSFTNGNGLSYSLLYKTNLKQAYVPLAKDLSAISPYEFTAPKFSKDEHITDIAILFNSVPPGFGEGNIIEYEFKVSGKDFSNSYDVTGDINETDKAIAQSELAFLLTEVEKLLSNPAEALDEASLSSYQNATLIFNDPYASTQQIQDASQNLQNIIANNNNHGPNFTLIFILLPIFIFLILISVFLILLKRKQKKSDKR